MKNNFAIRLKNVSMSYKLYDKHKDRMKEALHPFRKKYHRDFFALRNINLDIEKGEILGIVGINGAGKSTLLKIISGVLQPTSGSLQVNGTIASILELGSGMNPEYTGMENIYFYCSILGFKKDEIDNMLDEIIDFAEIGEFIHQPIKIYSSGMKARLSFAINTTVNPDILILDEVLAVGDVLFQRKCYSRIEKLFKDGKTVIFVSHSAQSVVEFCSRAVLLYDREIIMDDTPKKVTDYYQKLVFSKDKQKVLYEIDGKVEVKKEEQKQELEKTILKEEKNKKIDSIEVDKKVTLTEKFTYSKDYYIEGLKTEPKIINNANIKLNDICILNEKNEVVNKLITGNKYKIYFDIENPNLKNLTFGIAVQDIKGKSLSCIREHINIDKTNGLKFYWNFKCNLLNHKYFIKIDFRNGKDELYYQGTDILIFEVEKDKNKSCFVDLEQELEIIKCI